MVSDPAALLLAQLRREADATATARIDAAGAEASRMRTEAVEQVAQHRTARIAEREAAAVAALELASADAAQRVRHETLTARAAALDKVFSAAAERLPALDVHAGLGAVVSRAIADALACVPGDDAIVRCSRAVADAMGGSLTALGVRAAQLTIDDSVAVGAIVTSADGRIVADVTFARRLERDRRGLAIVVARRLAGDTP